MRLHEISRRHLDAAATEAVRRARLILVGGPYDTAERPISAPFHLAVYAHIANRIPRLSDYLSPDLADSSETDNALAREGFVAAAKLWLQPFVVATHSDPGTDQPIPGIGLSPQQMAPLKARTVHHLGGEHDLAHLILTSRVGEGDTRSFGALPLVWTDLQGRIHHFIGAGSGWHPNADREAVLQFPVALEYVLGTQWSTRYSFCTVASSDFVLGPRPSDGVYPLASV